MVPPLYCPGALPLKPPSPPLGVVFTSRITLPEVTHSSGVLRYFLMKADVSVFHSVTFGREVAGFWIQFLLLLLRILRKW